MEKNQGTIKNCNNTGEVSGTDENVGGVCGSNTNGTIENCDNTGKVSGKVWSIGGVCGYNYACDGTATIKNCNNAGEVSSTKNDVGGVCGINEVESGTATIENCQNTGKVSSIKSYVGGVCGYNGVSYGGTGTVTIKNCNSEAEVSGGNQLTGGVCGKNAKGTITNCYNTGEVSCTGEYVGGVCGSNDEGSIKNCNNTGEVSGTDEYGGVCGLNNAYYGPATIENCYNTGTVSEIDDGTEGGTYRVGGVCGENNACYGTATIKNCYNTGAVSGRSNTTNGNVGGVCGVNFVRSSETGTATSENCYYLSGTSTGGINGSDVTNSAEVKSTEKFASGEVCYLLNGSSSENPVWYQNIDLDGATADEYPVLDKSHEKVYQCSICTAVYSNTQGKEAAHSYKEDAGGNTHTCGKCGDTKEHSTSTYLYIADAENHSVTAHCADYCGKTYGTVTLIALDSNNLTYNGSEKAATLSGEVAGVTISDSDITYKQGETTLSSAPKDAGTYTASITLGTGEGAVAVSVEYTIEKATPEIGTVSVAELNNTLDTNQVKFSRTDISVGGTFALKDVTELQYGKHNYNYVFTPDDTDNYKPVEGTVSITVNDTIAPTAEYQIGENGWKKFVNTISFGQFCSDYKTVQITYSDVNDKGEPGSGVKTKQYYIADKELTEAEIAALEWNNYTSAISLNAEGVYFIYVKVEDNAGHSVVLNSEGIVIYAESALSPTSMDYTYKENRDLEVQITMNGNTFGKLTDGEGNTIAAGNYTIDGATGKLTLKAAYLDTLNVGQYTYKVSMNPQGQTTDKVTLTYSFVVNVKAQELTVTGATATDRKYDTTNVVNITAVELSGVKVGEDVSVNTTSLTGTLSGANVGEYTSVTLSAMTLTGADVGNYTLVQPTGAVPTNVTISKADAEITVGTDTYSKTFGDAAFNLSDVTDTNTEANVQYEVATGTDVITVSNGTVTIVKAGNATITLSLPASTNYNAAEDKTITVNVAKKSGYTVTDINRSYLYSKDNAENIDLSKYLPLNCGTVTYGTPQVNGDLYTDGGQPQVSSGGELSYTVKTGSVGTTGTIKVTVTTDNYEDFTLMIKVNLTDKIPVTLSGVTCGNRVYNGTAYAYTGTPVWKTEEGVTATGVTTVIYYKAGDFSAPVDAPTDAGNYWAEFTITSDEYVGTESYSFEITKAEITVAAKDRNIYIGDTVPDLTNPTAGTDYTVTGLYGTDALGGMAAMSYGQEPDNTKAGTYEIRISGLTVPEGDNYTITFTNGTLTITTKPSGGSTGGGGITGGSEVTTDKDSGSNVTTTTSPTEVKVENGTASATVKAANVTEAIRQAADNKSAQIVFTVSEKDTGNADKIRLTMTTSDVKQILDKTDADLVVATPAGDIILPQEALKETVSAAGGNTITFEIARVTTPTAAQIEAAGENGYIVEVTITSQNEAITTFGGNTLRIRLEIPEALAGKDVAVIYIAEDGKTEKMSGKTVTEGTKQYYEFTTTHLSTFALIEETEEENQPSEPTQPETPSEPTVPAEPTKPEVTAPKKGTLLTHSKTKMVYKISKSGTTGGTVQFVKTKNTKAKTVTIPDKVTMGGITYKVTAIATGALKNKKAITKVVIGKHVTKIGKKAFSGCSKLKVLKINSTKLTSKTLSHLSMKGISTKTVIKVPKSKVKAYKKLFVKKGLSKKVKVKSL